MDALALPAEPSLPRPDMPALSVEGVTLSYGKNTVVDDISFDVPRGGCFGLIGLNGEGKTTLIKSVLGLRENQGGAFTILGKPAHHKTIKNKRAYLPERFEPPWFLTGLEFLKFSRRLYDHQATQKAEEDDLFFNAAEKLALDRSALTRRMHTYSKGMRQKLGILSTVLTDSELLILDEPMSGLDPMARHMVKDLLKALRDEGKTVFFSSHILADMDELCDNVVVLHDTKIRYLGPPHGLCKDPKGSLEERFISLIGSRKSDEIK